ncbi:MAG TPA: serine/threonine-protein kinase, partial [Pirellulales bacterium]|nr:serine/threonine-protein kinase [Pirellulales bacterium]
MTVDFVAESRSDDSRVVSAVQQFLSALQDGRAPDRKQFAANFPEIASELEKCLEGLELVHQAASDLGRAPSAGPLDVNAAPNQLGDYRLLREIGRGGMGVVYEATQISLNRRVAVKVLPFAAAIDRTHVQRFRNEAQAAAQLHHSNIVPVYAVGDERGIHYYAMQFIDGQPLSHVIAQLKQPDALPAETTGFSLGTNGGGSDHPTEAHVIAATPKTSGPVATADTAANSQTGSLTSGMLRADFFRHAAELIRQAAEALDYAHQFGVVHRDIKPANLLIDATGTLWIADFGLAHIQADVSLTRTGDVLGTLAYMSPEQASGNRPVLDHRTDIYSLGVTLFELLTLEPIFPPSDRHVLLRRIIEEDPPPLRRVNPDIPVELEIIVGKAIAKDPQQRYATAGQLADDLQRWINDEPILAQPPTWTERMRKWSRRHRSLVRTAAAFVLLGFIGLLISTILIAAEQSKTEAAYQAEREQRLAADQSFHQARQAVDAFVQLGEDELANKPMQRALRRKFLETALEYYHDFLNQRRDDPNVQAELAASSTRVEQMIDELAVLEGYAPLAFLSDMRVGKELQLTVGQGDEIARRMARLAQDRNNAKSGGNMAARQHQLAAALREQQKAIAGLLSADQMTRLKQIAWQQQGPL